MIKLRVPTLQHLARNWFDSPEKIEKAYVDLAKNVPQFSYELLNYAARDYIQLGISEDQIAEGIRRKEKREWVRNKMLEVLPLLCGHFQGVQESKVQEVRLGYYPVSKNVLVPFRPPLSYVVGGQVYFPWFSFWRSNPITDDRLSLFVTLVEEMLLQDPDLEDARFQIFDFSARSTKEPRILDVIEAKDVLRVDETRKREMLAIFVEGFLRAEKVLAGMDHKDKTVEKEVYIDKDQLNLFT